MVFLFIRFIQWSSYRLSNSTSSNKSIDIFFFKRYFEYALTPEGSFKLFSSRTSLSKRLHSILLYYRKLGCTSTVIQFSIYIYNYNYSWKLPYDSQWWVRSTYTPTSRISNTCYQSSRVSTMFFVCVLVSLYNELATE